MFAPRVERWRSIASQVSPQIPAALILAVMTRESGGRPGLPGRSSDNGLMQVKPAVVIDYRRRHPDSTITHARMSGTSPGAAADQIRVGAWYLRHCLRMVHKSNPSAAPWPEGPLTDYQILLADLAYARGFGGLTKLRRRALAAGYQDTFEGLRDYREKHFPKWGKPGFPMKHAAAVLRMTRADIAPPKSPRPQPPEIMTAKIGGGGGLVLFGLVALALAARR